MSGILSKKVAKVVPVWLILLSATLVSAGVLKYFVTIHGTVRVEQAVVFSDGSTEKIFSFDEGTIIAGSKHIDYVEVKNRAEVPATVKFKTSISGPGCPGETCGITTSYWIVDEPKEIVPGEVNEVTPSTNEQNKENGWAYFNVSYDDVDVGEVKITFVQPRDFYACFEYRTDGDTSQKIREENYNTDITDGLYPYICLHPPETEHSETIVLSANEYVEIRMVFGAERDERFDWTKVDVLGTKIQEGEPFTIDAGETLTFGITNEFAVALEPGTYTITTELQPVEGE